MPAFLRDFPEFISSGRKQNLTTKVTKERKGKTTSESNLFFFVFLRDLCG